MTCGGDCLWSVSASCNWDAGAGGGAVMGSDDFTKELKLSSPPLQCGAPDYAHNQTHSHGRQFSPERGKVCH